MRGLSRRTPLRQAKRALSGLMTALTASFWSWMWRRCEAVTSVAASSGQARMAWTRYGGGGGVDVDNGAWEGVEGVDVDVDVDGRDPEVLSLVFGLVFEGTAERRASRSGNEGPMKAFARPAWTLEKVDVA